MRFAILIAFVALAAALPAPQKKEHKGPGGVIGGLEKDFGKLGKDIGKTEKGLGKDLKKAAHGIEKGLGHKVGGTTVGGVLVGAAEGALGAVIRDEDIEAIEALVAEEQAVIVG